MKFHHCLPPTGRTTIPPQEKNFRRPWPGSTARSPLDKLNPDSCTRRIRRRSCRYSLKSCAALNNGAVNKSTEEKTYSGRFAALSRHKDAGAVPWLYLPLQRRPRSSPPFRDRTLMKNCSMTQRFPVAGRQDKDPVISLLCSIRWAASRVSWGPAGGQQEVDEGFDI